MTAPELRPLLNNQILPVCSVPLALSAPSSSTEKKSSDLLQILADAQKASAERARQKTSKMDVDEQSKQSWVWLLTGAEVTALQTEIKQPLPWSPAAFELLSSVAIGALRHTLTEALHLSKVRASPVLSAGIFAIALFLFNLFSFQI